MNENTQKDPQKDSKKETDKPAKKGLTGKHVALILGLTLIVAAAVVAVIILTKKEPETPNTVIDVITLENVNEIMQEVQEKVAKGMFETHMNTIWTFPDGKSPSSDAIMGNAPSNNYAFYFTITLATGELVFTSGLMPVGTQIAEIVLDEDLDAGTYPAVVNINMVDDEGEPVESNMGINVTLEILS